MTRHHPTRRFASRLATKSLVPLTTNKGARDLWAGPQGARVGAGESRPAPPARRKHGGGWHRPVRRYREEAVGCHGRWRRHRPRISLSGTVGGASVPSRAMDESGELGGLETMETLTELGDELTLGDIDGEWWVGGWECGGARGGRGYGGARVRVRPPPAALASAGRISSRGRPGRTHPFGARRVWAPARLSVLRRRVSGSRAGVVGSER